MDGRWRAPARLRTAVARLVAALAALYAGSFVVCVAARLTFGFELSWLESGMQAMTARLGAHESIYAAPSPSYVPFIYPPLYYVVAHWIERALPALAGAMAMRFLSLASTVATTVVLWMTLGRRAVAPRSRLVLSALFLAFYGRFEFWHDTSRVDSMFVLLIFSASALLIEGQRIRSAVAAGAIGGFAILTKQPALPLLLGCGAVVMLTGGDARRVLSMVGAAVVCVVGGLAALGELHNPWFYYYVVQVPSTHPLLARKAFSGAEFVIGTIPLFLWAGFRALRDRTLAGSIVLAPPREVRRWALMFAVTVAIMSALHLKDGASANFFLPLVPVGIMMLAPWLARLGPRRADALLLAQFLILLYNPLTAIPTARDWQAGFELLGSLREVPGDVFLPQFPAYLATLGKAPVAHAVAVCDLAGLRPDLMRAIDQELNGGRFAAAVTWSNNDLRERCHLGVVPSRFRRAALIPEGGDFFAHEHGAHLGGIFRYVGAEGGGHS